MSKSQRSYAREIWIIFCYIGLPLQVAGIGTLCGTQNWFHRGLALFLCLILIFRNCILRILTRFSSIIYSAHRPLVHISHRRGILILP